MAFDKAKALADIDRVLTQQPISRGTGGVFEVVAAMRACIERYTPPGSPYREQAAHAATQEVRFKPDQRARGALFALRADIEADALQSFEERVHADVFSDLLAQAEYLNGDGHRRAAAVLAGAALEEHLRKLAGKHGIDITDARGAPRKASWLNTELYKANAYGNAERAQVEAWQNTRNDAAHGKPGFERDDKDNKYTKDEIRRMAEGVRGFILKHPA